jgi:hypothetical protein
VIRTSSAAEFSQSVAAVRTGRELHVVEIAIVVLDDVLHERTVLDPPDPDRRARNEAAARGGNSVISGSPRADWNWFAVRSSSRYWFRFGV